MRAEHDGRSKRTDGPLYLICETASMFHQADHAVCVAGRTVSWSKTALCSVRVEPNIDASVNLDHRWGKHASRKYDGKMTEEETAGFPWRVHSISLFAYAGAFTYCLVSSSVKFHVMNKTQPKEETPPLNLLHFSGIHQTCLHWRSR